jgi:uncharacterized protein YbjT (DUF2867 family)
LRRYLDIVYIDRFFFRIDSEEITDMVKLENILITGATGKQGGAIDRELLAHGHKIHAMTRHPDGEKARALARFGATVVHGDFDDPDSLEKTLKGM